MKKLIFWGVILAQASCLWGQGTLCKVPGDSYGSGQELVFEFKELDPNSKMVIYTADKTDHSKKKTYLSIPDVDNVNNPIEFHHGNIYAMIFNRSPNGTGWKRAIWKYDKNKHGTKLIEGELGGAFRVTDDERFLVLNNSDGMTNDDRLDILDNGGKLLKSYLPSDLGFTKDAGSDSYFEILNVEGHSLWLDDDFEEGSLSQFVCMNLDKGIYKTIPVKGDFTNVIFKLVNHHPMFLHDDIPLFGDTDTHDAFRAAKQLVHLYLYDVEKGTDKLIAEAKGREFNDKWEGTGSIEYDNPNGKGRLRKRIEDIPE